MSYLMRLVQARDPRTLVDSERGAHWSSVATWILLGFYRVSTNFHTYTGTNGTSISTAISTTFAISVIFAMKATRDRGPADILSKRSQMDLSMCSSEPEI